MCGDLGDFITCTTFRGPHPFLSHPDEGGFVVWSRRGRGRGRRVMSEPAARGGTLALSDSVLWARRGDRRDLDFSDRSLIFLFCGSEAAERLRGVLGRLPKRWMLEANRRERVRAGNNRRASRGEVGVRPAIGVGADRCMNASLRGGRRRTARTRARRARAFRSRGSSSPPRAFQGAGHRPCSQTAGGLPRRGASRSEGTANTGPVPARGADKSARRRTGRADRECAHPGRRPGPRFDGPAAGGPRRGGSAGTDEGSRRASSKDPRALL